jgi:glucans biosynthesis protein C
MQTNPRLYALDNLRAIMMWLGIVLHVSVNHVSSDFPIPWRDSQRTLLADMIVAFIHSFRMPVFFIVAGFFVAMLIDQRGATGMLKHRLKRLALPFAIFWPLIFPATVVLVMVFVHLMVRGTFGIDPTLVPKSPSGVLISTLHLWFLYMLIWFCVLAVLWEKVKSYVPSAGVVALQNSLSCQTLRILRTAWSFTVRSLGVVVRGRFEKSRFGSLPKTSDGLSL